MELGAGEDRVETRAEYLEPGRGERRRRFPDGGRAAHDRFAGALRVVDVTAAAEIVEARELTRIDRREAEELMQPRLLDLEQPRRLALMLVRHARGDRRG